VLVGISIKRGDKKEDSRLGIKGYVWHERKIMVRTLHYGFAEATLTDAVNTYSQ